MHAPVTTAFARAGRFTVVAITALGICLAQTPVAGADDLTDRRDRVNNQMADSQANLKEFSAELNQAAQTLATSRAELARARTALAVATAARQAAQAEDARQAKALLEAQARLAKTQREVAQNERRVRDEAQLIGATVRETHQQNTELLGIAAFVSDVDTGDVNTTMQWSSTIFNATQAEMSRLEALQVKLEAARKAQAAAERGLCRARACGDAVDRLPRGRHPGRPGRRLRAGTGPGQ